MRSGRGFSRHQGIEHDEDAAADDGGVGDVEVGPVVAPVVPADEDFEEVGDDAEADAVPDIAERAAEDEGERDGGGAEAAAYSDDHGEDDDDGEDGEGNQQPARAVGSGGIGEEAECCSGIEDMRDVEIVRDDGDRIAVGDVVLDPDFGPAIEGDDECGDDG